MNRIFSNPIALGITCALIAAFFFTLNDVGIKFLSGDYPLHEVVLIRALIALSITLAIFMPLEGGYHNLRTKRLGLHMVRGVFVVMANLLFFLGLASIPLSEATAIFFIAPVIITIFSVIFLGETVGVWRWFAVGAGLLGALIMLRPNPASFQIASLLPMFAAVCYATLHILSRKMGGTESASTLSFYIQLTFVLVSAAMGLTFHDGATAGSENITIQFLLRAWVMPTPFDFAVMAGVGVASAVGGYFISQAYRTSEAALVAPFEYVGLLLAIIWGIAIFDEWPDYIAWLGMALILSSGLLMLWRESVQKKRARIRDKGLHRLQ
ncbi:hypothetical protein BFP76_13100 [Amylibacter kogurei]|uniref:EamA domain-containing protein n=1 Tax=Paramylibacter kogurei TaxID=1889778 RepID=A0A2G5KBB8_9RHOB|nr:DMT family transporter [Amylibacter kogurei]PIB25924.1 hypothetical protein BFP76_13100 [Amylibacter kogurei]